MELSAKQIAARLIGPAAAFSGRELRDKRRKLPALQSFSLSVAVG